MIYCCLRAGISMFLVLLGIALPQTVREASAQANPPSGYEAAFVDRRQPSSAIMPLTAERGAKLLLSRATEYGSLSVMVRVQRRSEHSRADISNSLGTGVLDPRRQLLTKLGVSTTSGPNARAPGIDQVVMFDSSAEFGLVLDAVALKRLLSDESVVSVNELVPLKVQTGYNVGLINADDVWNSKFDGSNSIVVIFDTGIVQANGTYKNHPVFKNKIIAAAEACFSTRAKNVASTCPNNKSEQYGAGSAAMCSHPDCAHGTATAAVYAGLSKDFTGVARGSKIIPIQIGSFVNIKQYCGSEPLPCLRLQVLDVVRAFKYVTTLLSKYKNISTVNISLGSPAVYSGPCNNSSTDVTNSINFLKSKGIPTIIGSGNESFNQIGHYGVSWPGCIASAITVASTDRNDRLDPDSNISPTMIDFVAPGVNVQTALPVKVGSSGPEYDEVSGTSIAAPSVAGAWTLLKQAKPSASFDEIYQALTCSAIDVQSPSGDFTLHRIDVFAAYKILVQPAASTRAAGTCRQQSGTVLALVENRARTVGSKKYNLLYTLDLGSKKIGAYATVPPPAPSGFALYDLVNIDGIGLLTLGADGLYKVSLTTTNHPDSAIFQAQSGLPLLKLDVQLYRTFNFGTLDLRGLIQTATGLLVISQQGALYKLDLTTGTIVLQRNIPTSFCDAMTCYLPGAYSDGAYYGGVLYLLNYSPSSTGFYGSTLWRAPPTTNPTLVPIVKDQSRYGTVLPTKTDLLILTNDVYKVDPVSGAKTLILDTGGTFLDGAILRGGTVLK